MYNLYKIVYIILLFFIIRYVIFRKVQFGFYFVYIMISGLQINVVNILELKFLNKKIGGKTYVDVGKLFLEKGSCIIEMKFVNWIYEMEYIYYSIYLFIFILFVGFLFGMVFNVIN